MTRADETIAPPAPPQAVRPAAPTALDRFLQALPLVLVFVLVAIGYGVEAVRHATPTIFTDELEWTQLSRAIAATGDAARRGDPIFFKSLYAFAIAPAWWIKDTASAYDAAKYINVLVMCSAVFPAYWLARAVVTKPVALLVAAASVSIPAMAYSSYLIPEVLAYPYAALCAYASFKALATRRPVFVAGAVVVLALAPLVRTQLAIATAAAVLAALGLAWTSAAGRRLRRGWTLADRVAFALLVLGVLVVANRVFGSGVTQWQVTTEFWKRRIFEYGTWAGGAFAFGLGVLPVFGGLLSLFPRRGERLREEDRALIALTASWVLVFATYTAVKAAYLSTQFASLVIERNLIYLAPLLFLGCAVVVVRRRVSLVGLVLVTALLTVVVAITPLQLAWPYFEAPGYALLAAVNRDWYWTAHTLHLVMFVPLALSVLVFVAVRLVRASGTAARAGLALLAVVVLAWNVAGQVSASVASNDAAQISYDGLPHPPNWIDIATGGDGVTYLGQNISLGDAQGINLLEFWNRSIENVWTLDGTAPGPGPTTSPNVKKPDGTLTSPPGTPYVVADNGVQPVGEPLSTVRSLRLYRIGHVIRLADAVQGISSDGWMTAAPGYPSVADAAYSRFQSPGGRGGTLVVHIGRAGFCGDAPVGHATIRVGRLVLVEEQPALGRVWTRRSVLVRNCVEREVAVPVGPPPWRVQVHLEPTFRPSDYGGSDARLLGAQVGFEFRPAQPR